MSTPKYKEVPLDDLKIDPAYQRDPNDQKFINMVNSIVADFYPELLHALDVAQDDGKNWVWDGQARLAALKILRSQHRWPDRVMCKISQADRVRQANLFILQTHRRNLRGFEKHKAAVVAEDDLAVQLQGVFDRRGLTLGPTGNVRAVACCANVCKKYGPDVLDDTLRIAWGAWGQSGLQYGLSDRTLYGLALLLDEFDDTELDRDKALNGFKHVSPSVIHTTVTQSTSVHGSNNSTAVAKMLGAAYNKQAGARLHWDMRLSPKHRMQKKRRRALALA